MANNGLPVEKLREFLRQLPAGSRSLLIGALERALLNGDEFPGCELVLQELRRTIRDSGRDGARMSPPARLFFRPLEPFLVDDAPDHKHRGRIARDSLEKLWTWVTQALMPAECKGYVEEVTRVLAAGDTARAEQLARSLQSKAIERIEGLLVAIQLDEKARRRMTAQVNTPRALEDVKTVLGILKARDELATLGARLPNHIKSFADDQLVATKQLLDAPLFRQQDVFLYGLILVMTRLAAPWQLIRLATRAADSDIAARVAETPYAAAVTIVMGEIERLVSELKTDLKSTQSVGVASALKAIHDAARGLRTELDLPVESPWGRQLATIRTEIAGRLKSEIESMPGRVRRLLRLRPAKEIVPDSVLDAADVSETEKLIDFVSACRLYAGELAISEMTLRNWSELQNYLDTGTPALVDALRSAGDADRPFRESQVDAAVRFCGKVFGADYAAALAKSAEVAMNSAAERQAAARQATARG
jgi:hypothetical protein